MTLRGLPISLGSLFFNLAMIFFNFIFEIIIKSQDFSFPGFSL